MAINYKDCEQVMSSKGDAGFCSVISLATACDIPAMKAADVMEKFGRKYRQGAYTEQSLAAMQSLGYETPLVTEDYPKAKTVTSAAKVLPKDRTFVIVVRGHILTIRKGQVCDWTEGRRHQVKKIFEVVDTMSKNQRKKLKRGQK